MPYDLPHRYAGAGLARLLQALKGLRTQFRSLLPRLTAGAVPPDFRSGMPSSACAPLRLISPRRKTGSLSQSIRPADSAITATSWSWSSRICRRTLRRFLCGRPLSLTGSSNDQDCFCRRRVTMAVCPVDGRCGFRPLADIACEVFNINVTLGEDSVDFVSNREASARFHCNEYGSLLQASPRSARAVSYGSRSTGGRPRLRISLPGSPGV